MPEQREYQTEAVVIKKIKLGEADRILTLYTRDFGKIEAVAKGVRRPKSKLAGHLELLTHSQIRVARGRNLDTIIGSQTIDSFESLRNDFWLTSYGLYAAELVNQFNPRSSVNPPMFELLIEILRHLSQAQNSEIALRYFEMSILELSGYRPQLLECVACRSELKPEINAFCSSAGGALCPNCQYVHPTSLPLSVDALKVLRFIQRNNFEKVSRLKVNSELAGEMKNIMAGYLRYILEKEVRSADWLDSLNGQVGQPQS